MSATSNDSDTSVVCWANELLINWIFLKFIKVVNLHFSLQFISLSFAIMLNELIVAMKVWKAPQRWSHMLAIESWTLWVLLHLKMIENSDTHTHIRSSDSKFWSKRQCHNLSRQIFKYLIQIHVLSNSRVFESCVFGVGLI